MTLAAETSVQWWRDLGQCAIWTQGRGMSPGRPSGGRGSPQNFQEQGAWPCAAHGAPGDGPQPRGSLMSARAWQGLAPLPSQGPLWGAGCLGTKPPAQGGTLAPPPPLSSVSPASSSSGAARRGWLPASDPQPGPAPAVTPQRPGLGRLQLRAARPDPEVTSGPTGRPSTSALSPHVAKVPCPTPRTESHFLSPAVDSPGPPPQGVRRGRGL